MAMEPEMTGEIRQELAALRERVEQLEQELGELRGKDVRQQQATAAPPQRVETVPAMLREQAKNRADRGNQSLEDKLGSQVFNRVGIIALLIGTTWFLKWAIDNQWIGAMGRVLIGLVAGAGIVLWSERFRRQGYGAFSYSLKAVGSGVLYLSLWAGFHLYHLMPAAVALGAMVLVTAWNAYMAWMQDAEMLAAYALIGGLATPALLSSGGNHEVFLFSYLLAMNAATLALVALKPWPRLLLGKLPVTTVYFVIWYIAFFSRDVAGVTALLIGLLFAVFAAVGLIALDRDGVIAGVFAPTGAAAFGALAWYSVLEESGRHNWLPWLMVSLGAVYLGLVRLGKGRTKAQPAEAVHLSLAVVFLTIAIPLKASGRWITAGWLMEGVALLWVSERLASGTAKAGVDRVLRWLACGALLLGWVGAACQPFMFDVGTKTALWNARFATELLGIAAMAASTAIAWRARQQASLTDGETRLRWLSILGVTMVAGNLLAVLAGVREIGTYWGVDAELAEALSISGFLMLYGAALLAAGFWRRMAFVRWQGLVLLAFTIFKVFLYDMRSLSAGYRVLSFIGLGALLMAVSFAYQKDWIGLRGESEGTR